MWFKHSSIVARVGSVPGVFSQFRMFSTRTSAIMDSARVEWAQCRYRNSRVDTRQIFCIRNFLRKRTPGGKQILPSRIKQILPSRIWTPPIRL